MNTNTDTLNSHCQYVPSLPYLDHNPFRSVSCTAKKNCKGTSNNLSCQPCPHAKETLQKNRLPKIQLVSLATSYSSRTKTNNMLSSIFLLWLGPPSAKKVLFLVQRGVEGGLGFWPGLDGDPLEAPPKTPAHQEDPSQGPVHQARNYAPSLEYFALVQNGVRRVQKVSWTETGSPKRSPERSLGSQGSPPGSPRKGGAAERSLPGLAGFFPQKKVPSGHLAGRSSLAVDLCLVRRARGKVPCVAGLLLIRGNILWDEEVVKELFVGHLHGCLVVTTEVQAEDGLALTADNCLLKSSSVLLFRNQKTVDGKGEATLDKVCLHTHISPTACLLRCIAGRSCRKNLATCGKF